MQGAQLAPPRPSGGWQAIPVQLARLQKKVSPGRPPLLLVAGRRSLRVALFKRGMHGLRRVRKGGWGRLL